MGPIIKCYDPIIDYGLVKVNTSENFEITVENQSPINAELMIKKSENKRLNFLNMLTGSQVSLVTNDSSTASLVFDRPFKTKAGNTIRMENYGLQLKPFEKQTIQVNLRSEKPEQVEEYFEIMVKVGKS